MAISIEIYNYLCIFASLRNATFRERNVISFHVYNSSAPEYLPLWTDGDMATNAMRLVKRFIYIHDTATRRWFAW